eukprot:894280-Pyramimonas_sp.AAC.1
MLAHRPRASWPHSGLHRRPQRLRPHAPAAPMSVHPTRLMARNDFNRRASVVAFACARRTHVGTPRTRFVAS